ncbi:craniofacial development protein 2-like [Halyomorpha halys]|uniref:craniofacial development protein 2-like n=1 Tax=Halyomorpha halys TaxID=286706 RepID=UPI0034D1CE09
MTVILEEIVKYKVDILRKSKVKSKGIGEMSLDKGYTLIYSGVAEGEFAKEGAGFVVGEGLYKKMEDWEAISPRIIKANFHLSRGKITLVQHYAPTQDSSVIKKEQFYSDLERITSKFKSMNRKIICFGDFNARTGWNYGNTFGVIGKHGGERTKNENGQRLIDFCIENNILILLLTVVA